MMRAALQRELAWLDRLLHREVLRMRAVYALSVDEFRGIFVSDEQVDAYLGHLARDRNVPPRGTGINIAEDADAGPRTDTDTAAEIDTAPATNADADHGNGNGNGNGHENKPGNSIDMPGPQPTRGSVWATACERLALSTSERCVLLLALAPEFDRKYESLIAYLNNDIGRRWPTADLAARLFDSAPGIAAALDNQGRLFTRGILEPVVETGTRRPLLATAFAAATMVTRFIEEAPPALPRGCTWAITEPGCTLLTALPPTRPPALPPTLPATLATIAAACAAGADCPALVLAGPPGCGRQRTAEAFAARLGQALITVDLGRCADLPATLKQVTLAAALHHALVLLDGLPSLARHDSAAQPGIEAAIMALAALPGPLLLRVDPAAATFELPAALITRRVNLAPPNAASQHLLWQQALEDAGIDPPAAHVRVLAERFRLGRAQIQRASRAAAFAADRLPQPGLTLLLRAAREQSGVALKRLATAIPHRHGWDDLVLPPPTIERVRAVALAIAHRSRVQEEWGMARIAGSGGMVALFHGPSGTGKTMTASVIAAELGLELYRVDLASVVSKYIGETEKNLERIFAGARHSNAVLLFDEADALFGKRSEVKDAHDRYANVEVAYLLQRLEEHDGPVILATNFSRNMDQAFNRRLDQSVEFPRPDVIARARLWRQMLRPPLPCADGLARDLDWLAATFDLTGGEIRKAALEAAYLAAAGENIVTLDILISTATQECRRQGRMVGLADSMPPTWEAAA